MSVLSATAEDTSAQAEEEAKELAAQKAAEEEAQAAAQKAAEEEATVAALRTVESTGDVPEMKAAAAGETTGKLLPRVRPPWRFLCVS